MQNTALFPLIAGGGIVDGRSVTALRDCCSGTLLKPAWMLNHRCRTNEKEEQTDDARLQQQIMIVAHGSWVTLSSLLETTPGGAMFRHAAVGGRRCVDLT
jgi:hypothetical protein